MMRWWADEFDRLREHGRVIKMSVSRKSAFKVGLLPQVASPLVRHVGVKERQK